MVSLITLDYYVLRKEGTQSLPASDVYSDACIITRRTPLPTLRYHLLNGTALAEDWSGCASFSVSNKRDIVTDWS